MRAASGPASAAGSTSASTSASALSSSASSSSAVVSVSASSVSSVPASASSSISVDLDERKIAETVLKAADDKLQSLCVAHAATFVAVERRGSELSSSLSKLICTLDSSVEGVATSKRCLETAADEGKESTLTTLAEKHRLRRRTLLQHSSLLELLELPNLMDACVRGHLYEEALSIASFANTLERRHLVSGSTTNINTNTNDNARPSQDSHLDNTHGNCNPVVANVVNEVRKRQLDLRRHLLHRLRSDVTMPQCLEVVTALRRLNSVDLERSSLGNAANTIDLEKVHEAMERRLQVDFLEARDVWLDGTAASASASTTVSTVAAAVAAGMTGTKLLGKSSISMATGKSEQLLDSIDVYRTRCFEITTQFLAIFRTSSQQTTSSTSLTKSADHALQLLSIWTTRRIHYFIHTVLSKTHLARISDATTLRDALDSANFFATSMGRIGADFSPLLPTVFEPCLQCIVTSHWIDGVNAFKETLKVCRDAGIASPLHSTSGTTTTNAPDHEHNSTNGTGNHNHTTNNAQGTTSHQNKTPSPPRQLLSLPPLARLVNAFLTGLNELRRCLLPNAFPKLRAFFTQEFVTRVKEICHQNERVVLTPGFLNQKGEEAGKLRTLAVELKETFETCVEPYLSGALEVAIGVFAIEKVDIICQQEEKEENEENEEKEENEESKVETSNDDDEVSGVLNSDDIEDTNSNNNEEKDATDNEEKEDNQEVVSPSDQPKEKFGNVDEEKEDNLEVTP